MTLLVISTHPGEVLAEFYLEPLGICVAALAKCLDLLRMWICEAHGE